MEHSQSTAGFLCVYDFETITVSTSAIGFTSAKIEGNQPDDQGKCRAVLITCEDETVRYRFDSAPTASVGHELAAQQSLVLANYQQIKDIKFIRKGSSDGKLQVSFQR